MSGFLAVSSEHDRLAKEVVDAALVVHRTLGPGLLESVYEACLCYELTKRGVGVQRQVTLPVVYDSVRIEAGLKLDILVEELVIVELKAVEQMLPLFDAQLLTYLKLANKRLGLLINFNVPRIKDGIKRLVR